jgi:hypothetical protein
MRRILGAIGVIVLAGGFAALTPLLAALGAGVTLTVVTLGVSIWRSIGRRGGRLASDRGITDGVR